MDREPPVLLVPAGAEERAVRGVAGRARVVAIAPGAAAANLPPLPPGRLILLGLCGALRGGAVGETVRYRSVCDATGRFDLAPIRFAPIADARSVAAITADAVVTEAAERRALAARFDADVVDMEGTHVLRALRAAGREAAMLRVISDDGSYRLPPLAGAIDEAGRVRPSVVATAFARAPVAAFRFVRDVRHALAALARVARALDDAG